MEKNLDILEIFQIKEPESIKYFAEYDPVTGEMKRVGPEHAFSQAENKIEIDEETALGILKGEIKFNNCFVDIIENKFYFTENKSIVKIDDLLYRISEEKYADHDNPHIFLTLDKNSKTVKIEMSELYHGTKKWPKKYTNIAKRRVHWTGETKINFLITAYNDPTIMYESFNVSVNDLIDKAVTIKLKFIDVDNFSIFTRRIFKNYSIKIK